MKEENVFDIGRMHISLFLLGEQLPKEIILTRQTHSANIRFVQQNDENLENYDALITDKHDLTLGIKTADCAPICFSDKERVGIAHIGWRGLCLGLIEKMLAQFNGADLQVYVGPFLNSFEIQKDFCYDKLKQKFGGKFFHEESDKFIFDFRKAIDSLLPRQAVFDPRDTQTALSFPSYRREKMKGNFVTAVSFRAP
jgi:hypothetical protein